MRGLHKNFPPGWHHLMIPLSSRRAALAGLSLYAACRPRAAWAQRAAWVGIVLFGPRSIPGRAVRWTPMDDGAWEAITDRWRRELGPFDAVAGYQRTISARGGCAVLLLQRGRPLAFVKLRPHDGGETTRTTEELAIGLVAASRPRSFAVPELLSSGVAEGWRYFATTALPARLHRAPASPPLPSVVAEIEAGLEGLARAEDVPSHWRPMHGDFTPWNLRESGRRLFLIDWEHAGWGPPHADEIGYRLSASVLGLPGATGMSSAPSDSLEAVRYWVDQAATWGGTQRDEAYAALALDTLGRLEARLSAESAEGSDDRRARAGAHGPPEAHVVDTAYP